MNYADMETPCLILDQERFEANAAKMRAHCDARGVALRPHLKTLKSVDAAKVATGGMLQRITVSTLREAEVFARAGFDDILHAAGITPNKFDHVRKINAETGKRLILTLDSIEMAQALVQNDLPNSAMIEIDCGEHRGGIGSDNKGLEDIARMLGRQFTGIMTHAGHSYSSDQIGRIKEIADDEVNAATTAATRLRAAGIEVPSVSVGSTPTVLHADSLDGVDEVRCGIYMVWDLSQFGRGICALDDLALTVLATVIGHNRSAGVLTVDAGALAMSKDIGANTYLPDARFGWLCDANDLTPLGLSIDTVHQEHGTVVVKDPSAFDRLPIGTQVRILPGHACLTAAGGYEGYHLRQGGFWPRFNGW
ncbi:alanine racemase [Sulfitobacter sp. M368]|uniref:alanine racemase n=1 Tax=Sulfitobacter sp. M368 TaxID=2867021 RepID=UPI0021A8A29D|nr:alanine racemase [Sulfitobacter sp. M368]UWR16683.1 alanine racemase [Sulfitobacter sp. M368]